MNTYNYNISLTYQQVLRLVKQLPFEEKAKLGKELAKETMDKRLSRILNSFKTDELSQEEIDIEVEAVRTDLYAKTKNS